MKTLTVAAVATLLATAALAAGCSKDKPKTTPTPPAPERPAPVAETKVPTAQLQQDQPVSGGLAVSGDILTACGIKPLAAPAPNFDYDQADLSPDDRQVLDQIATCLMTGPLKGRAVELIGRADPRGTEEYNLGLGSRRASSVSTYLARLGVGAGQLETTTRGALDATGTDEAGYQRDRRVDITLR